MHPLYIGSLLNFDLSVKQRIRHAGLLEEDSAVRSRPVRRGNRPVVGAGYGTKSFSTGSTTVATDLLSA
jgi:hypothetical protein